MPTPIELMIAGEPYDPLDAELVAARLWARQLCHRFNHSPPEDELLRRDLVAELIAAGGATAWIEPPFYCDYGSNIFLGRDVYFNFNCTVLDVCPVRIGDFVKIGPSVQIYAATHPMDAAARRVEEFGKPVTIGDDVWIGGGAIICPGVSIGEQTVVGAGSVVTRSLPPRVLAAGNPCRVIRELGS